ncbi:MAG: O-antigen ligase family protein, partial [Acidobacteria bacterium]|nr:O-antigen ligase family protein [Acidobacteriota bacterium]
MSSKASGSRSEIAAASIGLVTAVGLLATLLPIPRALAMSNQPWVGELVISGLLFAFVVWALLSSDRIKFCGSVRSTLIFMCAFTVWSLCSLLWASDDWAALHHTFEWVIYACVVLLAASLIENGNAYRPLMYGLGFTAIILFLICASDFLSVADFASSETVIRIRYGKFGEMTALIAPLLAGAGLYGRSKKYLIMSAAAWMCSWMVTMLSLSKGAFIAGIIGHAVMFIGVFIFTKQGRRRALIACLGWVVLTLGAQAYSSYATSVPATTDYITGAADRTRSTSEMRVFTWKTSWTLAKTHLLLGVGGDNFGVRFNEARILRAHSADDNSPEIAEDYVVERAHNEALQMLAELGIPGVILCCLIFVPLLLC